MRFIEKATFNKTSNRYLIIGFGRFGKGFAKRLLKEGIKESRIYIADTNKENLQEAQNAFSNVFVTAVHDFEDFNDIDINDIDIVVIALSQLENSLIIAANKLKHPNIRFIAKAKSEIHKRLLETLGVDVIALPEEEVGSRLAYQSLYKIDKATGKGKGAEITDFNTNYDVVEVRVLNKQIIGKTLAELNIRDKFDCNFVFIERNQNGWIPLASDQLLENDLVTVFCLKKQSSDIFNFFAA